MRRVINWLQGASRLHIIAFFTGAALMVFELVAARILAPTIGSSTYVWTSVIGTIIAALSLGYFVGGKLADRRNRTFDVVLLCLLAAMMVGLAAVTYPGILETIPLTIADSRLQGVVASLILFVPTSFLLGTISPYLVKLAIKSLHTSGRSVAALSALNSLGGIVGTFVTGFILFNYIGSRETLLVVVTLLLLSSWLLLPRRHIWPRILVSLVVLFAVTVPPSRTNGIVAEIDTASAHYRVIDYSYQGRNTRLLLTGPGAAQSGVFLDGSDELAFWYTRFAAKQIIDHNPDRVLVLGGGVFTLPSYLASHLPDATIDVVEIDPKLRDIAKQFFNFKDKDNLRLFFEDARTFVNQSDEVYDVIFVDVYGDTSIPFTFLTEEYAARINDMLTDNGIVLLNVIGGHSGACGRLVSTIDAMYRPYFPNGFWQTETTDKLLRGNYIMLYQRQMVTPWGMQGLASSTEQPFTDNFAPVERLHFLCQQSVL